MMTRDFIAPAIPEVLERFPRARDKFLICDLPGFHQAGGAITPGHNAHEYRAALHKMQHGDMSLVPAADAYLREMEAHVFVSRAYRTIDDVVGSFPNVPNVLAGVPCAMRRRVRVAKETAPLVVITEQAPSGSITSEQMARRGAAVLALVQLLANKRPVELWGTVTLGDTNQFNSILYRIETAPLDLARAAFMLCDDDVTRVVGYQLIQQRFSETAGGFAYGAEHLERKYAAQAFGRAIDASAQVLYVSFMHSTDKALNNPIAWIKTNLALYGGETYQQED